MGSEVVVRKDSSDLDGQEGTEKVEDKSIWWQSTLNLSWENVAGQHDNQYQSSWQWTLIIKINKNLFTSWYQEKAGNLGQKTAARRGLSCLSDKVKHGDLWLSKNSRNLNGAGRKLAEYFIKGCEVTIPADWRWQERRNLREGEIPILRRWTQKHNLRLGGVAIVNRKYKNI